MWMWHRFRANEDDWRPVKFPPPGPFWCTGYGDGFSIVVAYLPPGVAVTNWWPEASHIDSDEREYIVFTGRFQKPDWWLAASRAAAPEEKP